MKFKREYLLKADLREIITCWADDMAIVDRYDKEKLVERIFYMLLYAGDLKEERPVRDSGKRWLIDVTGLSDEEARKKVQKAVMDIKKGRKGEDLFIKFTSKLLQMKVDKDSPFRGEVL